MENEAAQQQLEYSRREFLNYAWLSSMALLLAEAGLASLIFALPRFRAGEFGGVFSIGSLDQFPIGSVSQSALGENFYNKGRFWLVRTGPNDVRAHYRNCTHLGCLYKWVSQNDRFECPCHGSKFRKDGSWISGPAPRNLDYFEVEVDEQGNLVVNTGELVRGEPHA